MVLLMMTMIMAVLIEMKLMSTIIMMVLMMMKLTPIARMDPVWVVKVHSLLHFSSLCLTTYRVVSNGQIKRMDFQVFHFQIMQSAFFYIISISISQELNSSRLTR